MYLPTANAARAGTQIGQVVYASVKRRPRAARRSRLGVCIILLPEQPIQRGSCSSDMMITRFAGFIFAWNTVR